MAGRPGDSSVPGAGHTTSRSAASDLQIALNAARAGAAAVASGLRQPTEVAFKAEADPVTEVDHRSERAILDLLSEYRGRDPVVSEEWGGSLPGSGRCGWSTLWTAPPTSSTGSPGMGVSVALWIDDAPTVGVVVDVINGDEYTAVAGAGARVNGTPIVVSTVENFDEALVTTGFPYNRGQRVEICDTRFRRVLAAAQGIRRMGAASLDMCMVACGRMDGYWEEDLSLGIWARVRSSSWRRAERSPIRSASP